eukprot:3408641-Pleurochrysis_carterae.AAC.1
MLWTESNVNRDFSRPLQVDDTYAQQSALSLRPDKYQALACLLLVFANNPVLPPSYHSWSCVLAPWRPVHAMWAIVITHIGDAAKLS